MTQTEDTPVHDKARQQAARWVVRLSERPDLADSRRFRRWHAAPANAAAFGAAQRAWGLAGSAGAGLAVAPPRRADHRRRARRPAMRAAGLMAAVALVLLCGLALRGDLLVGWRADYATARGETRGLTLADGSSVLLDAGSALDVVAMGPDRPERIVRLVRGQAFFDVAHSGAPFVVEAGEARIRVLGTRFDVRLIDDGTSVVLEDGAVSVAADDAPGQTLKPGQGLRVAPGDVGRPVAVDLDEATAWRAGRYVFYDRPLAEVVEALERHGPGRLVLAGAGLSAQRVSGSILLADSAAALDALAQGAGFRILNLPGGIKFLVR
ncbi:FecR family protein [Marinibacterium sp. SX1]|uniref:FecR family protein n=1 Tax=Marinibacterium sp. SX1 TaxID=3388424 RepID=UPI003D1672C2